LNQKDKSCIFEKTDAMQTIRLRVSDKLYNKLLSLLSRFSEKDIQVITENEEFLSIHQYLKKELGWIESGDAEFIEVDQLEQELEATIRKHEAKIT
jgi:hypothetical protein